MGAARVFGFQLLENGPGQTRDQRSENWSCIAGVENEPWQMPEKWFENRNSSFNFLWGRNLILISRKVVWNKNLYKNYSTSLRVAVP